MSPSIFGMVRSLACPSRIEFLPCFDRRPSSEKHGLLVPVETSSSWDQSTSDYWMYSTCINDVIDVLGEVLWQQYSVLQCRINEITSWMHLNCSEIQEVLGIVRVQATLKLLNWSSFLCRQVIQSLIDHCEVPSNFALNSSIISSTRTAPSSSWGIDGSCRNNLIMAFDKVKQSWRNLSELMSIQFLSRTGIEMGDSVTVGFGCGFAFGTGFPVTLLNVFFFTRNGFWRFGYVFVNSIHNSNPRNCSVSKQGFDHDFDTVTFLMRADLHIQDRADLRVSENPPSHSGCFFASK